MSLSNSLKKNSRSVASNLNNIRIHRSQSQTTVPMLSQRVAPAGIYKSRITNVIMSRTTGGDDAVDVIHELTAEDGKVVQGCIRYILGGHHLACFYHAMLDAGVPEENPITDAIGVEELLEIVYPQRGSLAKIKSRRPLEEPGEKPAPKQKSVATQKPVVKHQAPAPAADDGDDDFDDFLEDDEDDI